MSHSLAQTFSLNCPQCRQAYSADVWLIVDAVAQPELIDLIRDGALHNVACPHCGHAQPVDVPLLLYRPGADPPILFSPAQQTDRTQDEQHARELVARLRDGLGATWQDAWLAEGLPSVERSMLPVALSDDPQAPLQEMQAQVMSQQPLLHALDQFIRAESWNASRQVVQAHPELLDAEADDLLAQLITAARQQDNDNGVSILSEHRALLQACRVKGIDAAFAAKMRLSFAEDLEAATRATKLTPAVRAVLTELAAAGVEINSPEDIQRLLAERPELQAQLAEASGSALPVELESILNHLSQPPRSILDMPRRIELCRQALVLLPRAQNPSLWAALQNTLANSLAQTPRGDRAENQEQAIAAYRQVLEVMTRQAMPVAWATTMMNLANVYADRIRGERAENLEQAIAAYRQTLEVMTRQAMPMEWATTMMNLANTYVDRIRGDRAENLEQAIAAYRQALEVRTRQAMPVAWATTMTNLATAYADRIRGNRAENLEQAIAAYRQALAVRTRQAMPMEWATTINNLANAYIERIHGNRAENLEQAIAAYRQVLEVRTRQAMPEAWAQTMMNLAIAYADRIRGDRAENLEQAIAAFRQALEVFTRQAMPVEWATTMNNLANAYRNRIRGDRAENLEQAIAAYRQALEVMTRQAIPLEWAGTMMNLAIAYRNRIRGDRAENLEQAIVAYRQALEVTTRQAMPVEWATTINNLANAYANRIRGDRAENLEQAIAAYRQALEVTTRQAMPVEWAQTMNNLANVYADRIRGDRAENLEQTIAAHLEALEVFTQQAMPLEWAGTMMNLANAYADRIRGDRGENLEQAIAAYRQALEVRTRQAMPVAWAQTMMNLANAYLQRIRGDRGENLEQAIAAYRQALDVFTPVAFPEDCYHAARQLGRLQAQRAAWPAAAAAYRQALEADEILFQAALLREGKQRQLARTADLYQRAALALARSGDAAAAVETVEQGRARLLREHLERNRRDLQRLPQLGYQALYDRYRDAVQQWQDLSTQARAAAQRPLGETSAPTFQAPSSQQLEQAQAAIQALIAEIQAVPGYANFMRSLTIAEIQAQAADAPLVYLLTGEQAGLALVVTADAVETIWADFDNALLDTLLVRHDGETVTGGYLPGQLFGSQTHWLEESLVDLLPQLGEKLLSPVADYLRSHKCSGAILIPTGQLGLLPLHAARYRHNGRDLYLQDEFDVAYAPSAQALAAARRWLARHAAHPPLLAGVGNPLPHPKPLDFAHAELEDIAVLFEGRARPLYGTDAAKDALLAQLSGASHIHLACHGLFDLENPLHTHLQLAHGETLTLEEILNAAPFTNARLVALSACQTGISEFRSLPDEVIGLPAGVLQGGVPGVVGTLWPVNDLSTALIMTKFYAYHLHGDPATGEGPMPPVRALGHAQRWLRQVTAAELTAYFEAHKALHDAQQRAVIARMPEAVAAEGIYRFGFEDPQARPFADQPYHWAPFIFMGV